MSYKSGNTRSTIFGSANFFFFRNGRGGKWWIHHRIKVALGSSVCSALVMAETKKEKKVFMYFFSRSLRAIAQQPQFLLESLEVFLKCRQHFLKKTFSRSCHVFKSILFNFPKLYLVRLMNGLLKFSYTARKKKLIFIW